MEKIVSDNALNLLKSIKENEVLVLITVDRNNEYLLELKNEKLITFEDYGYKLTDCGNKYLLNIEEDIKLHNLNKKQIKTGSVGNKISVIFGIASLIISIIALCK